MSNQPGVWASWTWDPFKSREPRTHDSILNLKETKATRKTQLASLPPTGKRVALQLWSSIWADKTVTESGTHHRQRITISSSVKPCVWDSHWTGRPGSQRVAPTATALPGSGTPHKHPRVCPSQNWVLARHSFKGKDGTFSNKFHLPRCAHDEVTYFE